MGFRVNPESRLAPVSWRSILDWLFPGPVRAHSCQRLLRGQEGWNPGPPGCMLVCLQALAGRVSACCKLGEATGSGGACWEVGDCFCRNPATAWHTAFTAWMWALWGMWATYWFLWEDRNLEFTREFPMLWSNNKNPCSGQTNILVAHRLFSCNLWVGAELRRALSWGCGRESYFALVLTNPDSLQSFLLCF